MFFDDFNFVNEWLNIDTFFLHPLLAGFSGFFCVGILWVPDSQKMTKLSDVLGSSGFVFKWCFDNLLQELSIDDNILDFPFEIGALHKQSCLILPTMYF